MKKIHKNLLLLCSTFALLNASAVLEASSSARGRSNSADSRVSSSRLLAKGNQQLSRKSSPEASSGLTVFNGVQCNFKVTTGLNGAPEQIAIDCGGGQSTPQRQSMGSTRSYQPQTTLSKKQSSQHLSDYEEQNDSYARKASGSKSPRLASSTRSNARQFENEGNFGYEEYVDEGHDSYYQNDQFYKNPFFNSGDLKSSAVISKAGTPRQSLSAMSSGLEESQREQARRAQEQEQARRAQEQEQARRAQEQEQQRQEQQRQEQEKIEQERRAQEQAASSTSVPVKKRLGR